MEKANSDALVGRAEGKTGVGEALLLTAKGLVESSRWDLGFDREVDLVW